MKEQMNEFVNALMSYSTQAGPDVKSKFWEPPDGRNPCFGPLV